MNILSTQNPLGDLINNETYSILVKHGLLHEKSLRDYQIRKTFKQLRKKRVPATQAIEQIRSKHPYLQFDTIRKIVYQSKKIKHLTIKY